MFWYFCMQVHVFVHIVAVEVNKKIWLCDPTAMLAPTGVVARKTINMAFM